MVAAFDLLSVLLSTFLALVLLMVVPEQESQIETFGAYAITMSWTTGSRSDVDLYVKEPGGGIVYFGSRDAGLLHLEHDDRGVPDRRNYERIVLRGEQEGEFLVNVQMYRKREPRAAHIRVELWRLLGRDAMVHSQRLVLRDEYEERTAFRFTTSGTYSRLPGSMFW